MSSDGARRFALSEFTGAGYQRGASLPKQILWLSVSRSILMRWWMPNRVRVAILRAFGAKIAPGVSVRHDVKIHWPWKLTVGKDSWIGEGVWILNLEPVTIGSDTCVSQAAMLCTGSHDRRSPSFEFDNAPIVIGDCVWVAARATVLRGVTVADAATIGAHTVVSRDVPAGATVLATRAEVVERP